MSDRDDILDRIAERTIPRRALLMMFDEALAARGVQHRLQPLADNETGRFHFGSGSVVLDVQRETYDGEPVWRARWRVERMPDWEGLPGMHALYTLVGELGPWFIAEPLFYHATRSEGQAPPASRVPELTVRDLELMRLRQRGG
jgi:hypothetical protein